MSSNTPYTIATGNTTTPVTSTAIISFAQRVNVDSSTNLNDLSEVEVPMDGALTTNQSGFSINGNGIEYTGTGTVWVKASFVVSVNETFNRGNLIARLALNDVVFGPIVSHGYIRNANGHQQSSYTHPGTWVEMTTGDIITIRTLREAAAGTISMDQAGTSQLLLERLVNV